MATMHTLETAEADIVYDVRGPLPTADGRPALFMIGQPMTASGFATLASHFPDRTVVTYDPRGLGRSTRKDGRVDTPRRLVAFWASRVAVRERSRGAAQAEGSASRTVWFRVSGCASRAGGRIGLRCRVGR